MEHFIKFKYYRRFFNFILKKDIQKWSSFEGSSMALVGTDHLGSKVDIVETNVR